jgi:lactate 2-monooxygenase
MAHTDPKDAFSAVQRQREIYLKGVAGRRPQLPVDSGLLEAEAKKALSPEAFAYIAGGAGKGLSMQANQSDFQRWRIWPRMLRDVSRREVRTELFGQTLPAPILLAPIGVLDMAHPEGDLLVARAAANLGVPMIFSNQASAPMEACAAEMGDQSRWFQLYWSKSDELVLSLVRRAEAVGCSAIVVTLDTTLLGWRTLDLEQAYLPFLRGKGIAQYVSDPVFQRLLEEPDEEPAPERTINLSSLETLVQQVSNYPGSFWETLRSGRSVAAVRKFISIYSRPSLQWENLAFLRKHTQLPILLKGILHPDDAKQALAHGVDGLIVSNHGGRQVDGSVSAIEALPLVVQAVDGQVPVLMDSGIRTGADVFKCLALGAQAVCLGRPYVYGLALAGEAGVREVIQNLWADFELTMALAGCSSVQEIGPHCLKAQ